MSWGRGNGMGTGWGIEERVSFIKSNPCSGENRSSCYFPSVLDSLSSYRKS